MLDAKTMNDIVELVGANQNEKSKLNAGSIREIVKIISKEYVLIKKLTFKKQVNEGENMKATKKVKAAKKATKPAAKPAKKAGY
jgi:hypothetical protein